MGKGMVRVAGAASPAVRGVVRRPTEWLRIGTGGFFLAAGLAKLTYSPIPGVSPGLSGFAEYLAAAGIPAPYLSAWVVCLTEVVAGAGLLAGLSSTRVRRVTPMFAGALGLEMAVAMVFVGVPTARGNPVVLDGMPVTAEWYRLPLEGGLFFAMLYLVIRHVADDRVHEGR